MQMAQRFLREWNEQLMGKVMWRGIDREFFESGRVVPPESGNRGRLNIGDHFR